MYKKSKISTSGSLFDSYSQQLEGTKLALLEDSQAWHNQFFQEITSRIDEDLFSVLYHKDNGRPNAPVRILVSMMILKDGQDWTDEQLFEACNFNILVCRALGLLNISDEAPCPATYYNFKLALLQHYTSTGENLLEKSFQETTSSQVKRYEVNGKKVRMDSKLLHSNVNSGTRLSLCLEVLRKFCRKLSNDNRDLLTASDKSFFADLLKESITQQTYRLDKSATADRLIQSGQVLYRLIHLFADSEVEHYQLIQRVWLDHFECDELESEESGKSGKIQLKDVKNQKGTTLQSAHDEEAAYRNKAGSKKQVVVGYVSNITETCAEREVEIKGEKAELPLRLITDVQTEKVTHSDDKFFIPAIQNSNQILGQQIEVSLTDGAYNSVENLAFVRNSDEPDNSIEWHLTAIQGAEGIYDFEKNDDDTYKVTDRKNGRTQTSTKTPTGKFRIENDHGKARYYYILPKTIDNYFRRQQIKKIPPNISALRANSEATMNQVFNNLDGAKTKYRGLFQHKIYAINRCFWTNLQRIKAQNTFLLFLAIFTHTMFGRASYQKR